MRWAEGNEWSFPSGSDGKDSACNSGDPGLIPGSGRSPRRRKWQPIPVSTWKRRVQEGSERQGGHINSKFLLFQRQRGSKETQRHSREKSMTRTVLTFLIRQKRSPPELRLGNLLKGGENESLGQTDRKRLAELTRTQLLCSPKPVSYSGKMWVSFLLFWLSKCW